MIAALIITCGTGVLVPVPRRIDLLQGSRPARLEPLDEGGVDRAAIAQEACVGDPERMLEEALLLVDELCPELRS